MSLRVGPIAYPIGSGSLLGAFFDTLTTRLEDTLRGSRFPALAAFYSHGQLDAEHAAVARHELATVRDELGDYPPGVIIWDIDDPTARPPWGNDIAPTITTLAEYFVTSDGRPLIAVLDAALEASARTSLPLRIT